MDVLLTLQPEELGPVILKLAAARMQNGMFNAQQVLTVPAARGMTATQVTPYAADKEREVNVALYEAWQWLVLKFRGFWRRVMLNRAKSLLLAANLVSAACFLSAST